MDANDLQHYIVEWEMTDKGIFVHNFPIEASIIPDALEQEIIFEYGNTPVALAWSKETGWAGLILRPDFSTEIFYQQRT